MTKRLLASYLALTAGILLTLELPLALIDERVQRQDLQAKVQRDVFAISMLAEDVLQSGASPARLKPVVIRYGRDTKGRVIVVDRRGRSVADSAPLFPGERNFASRPEIRAALTGQTVSGTRWSETLGTHLLYVAAPVASGGTVFGAVRVTYPTSALDARIARDRITLLVVAFAVLAGAAAIGIVLARSIGVPLLRVEETAVKVGAGDLDARAPEHTGPPEVRRLASELNRTTAKLQALLTSQEQFVADASHELRTPLTALRLRLENGDTEAALAEAARLAGLVDDLLTLARADAERETAAELSVDDVARDRVELWAPLADEHDVALRLFGVGGRVRAGRGRVEQVLDNLLANAVEASPRGSTIDVLVDGGAIHVIDQGPGLTETERERAFDRFWSRRKNGGSGLGLAISQRLVQLDGGTIELRAAASGGIDATVLYRRV
ncbi:MAG: ATP-binding protein [Gaiellaceae bacterium]